MTPNPTIPPHSGTKGLRRRIASVLTAVVLAAMLVLTGPAGPANAQIDAGGVSATRSVGSGVAEVITETAAVLRGVEALAFTYQKVEWLIGQPAQSGAQASSEQALVLDGSDRHGLVEWLGSDPLFALDRGVALLLCVDPRVLASTTSTNVYITDGTWCPEPAGEAAEAQTAATPVVFVCPTSALWDPGADQDTLRCPGTATEVERLLSATGDADPLGALRAMLHAYREAAGLADERLGLAAIVSILHGAPELGDLAAALGRARLDGALDLEILAAAGRGGRGLADLDELELRSVLHNVEILAVQLDDWHSGVTESARQFKVEIEGVTQGWRPWLDARSTNPRLFDEADALFGKRAGPSDPGALRPVAPDPTESEPGITTTVPWPSMTVPRSSTTMVAPRPTTTTVAPRPTTTVARPSTTVAPRPTTTTTTTIPRPTTTVAPRPTTTTTTTIPRPTTTVAAERPTTTVGR